MGTNVILAFGGHLSRALERVAKIPEELLLLLRAWGGSGPAELLRKLIEALEGQPLAIEGGLDEIEPCSRCLLTKRVEGCGVLPEGLRQPPSIRPQEQRLVEEPHLYGVVAGDVDGDLSLTVVLALSLSRGDSDRRVEDLLCVLTRELGTVLRREGRQRLRVRLQAKGDTQGVGVRQSVDGVDQRSLWVLFCLLGSVVPRAGTQYQGARNQQERHSAQSMSHLKLLSIGRRLSLGETRRTVKAFIEHRARAM